MTIFEPDRSILPDDFEDFYCIHCGYLDHLDCFDVMGADPGNVFCNNCDKEIDIDQACNLAMAVTEIIHLRKQRDKLLAACKAIVEHTNNLPDKPERTRILKLALNNRAGNMIKAAIAEAEK